MKLVFRKLPRGEHEIEVYRDGHADIRRRARETGPTIPHDLAHAAIEAALVLEPGFCSALADGAMFADFEHLQRGRHRRSGLRVSRRNSEEELLDTEMIVSWIHKGWSGQRTEGRGLPRPPKLTSEQVERGMAALDAAKRRWDALAEGEELVWEWPAPRRR